MFGVTALMGLAIGPVIGEMILQEFGFSTFFVSATIMSTTGLLFHLHLPESYVHISHGSSKSFFSVLKNKRTSTVALLALLFGIGLAASGGFVSPFAEEKHLAFISLYYLSYSSAAVLTRLLGGKLADRVGEERIIPYGLLLAGTGLLILIFLRGNVTLVLSGFLSGCAHGFLFPCLNALAIRNKPIELRGKVTGVFTGAIDAGAFIGSVFLGYIGEWAGFRALFLAAALALFLGFGIFKIQSQRHYSEKGTQFPR